MPRASLSPRPPSWDSRAVTKVTWRVSGEAAHGTGSLPSSGVQLCLHCLSALGPPGEVPGEGGDVPSSPDWTQPVGRVSQTLPPRCPPAYGHGWPMWGRGGPTGCWDTPVRILDSLPDWPESEGAQVSCLALTTGMEVGVALLGGPGHPQPWRMGRGAPLHFCWVSWRRGSAPRLREPC